MSGHHKMGQAEFLNVVSAAVIEFFSVPLSMSYMRNLHR
jgi:hypothetical protein